jgi:hypothetical protein
MRIRLPKPEPVPSGIAETNKPASGEIDAAVEALIDVLSSKVFAATA